MANKKRAQKKSLIHRMIHHAINTFVPRAHNAYHPHLISRYGLAVIALIGAGGIFFAANQQRMAVLGVEPAITSALLLRDVNAERAKQGDSPLSLNAKLASAALAKGKNMFAEQYWAHDSPSGVKPWKWIQDQNYSYTYAGENLAKNFPDAKSTVAAWMASPAHRENMLHDYYTDAGFAVVDGMLNGSATTIVVALFATPASSVATVAGVETASPAVGSGITALSRAGLSLQSMNPAVLGAVTLSLLAIIIAAITFASTHLREIARLQRVTVKSSPRGAWHQHHTVSKAIGLSAFVILSLTLFSGGQL